MSDAGQMLQMKLTFLMAGHPRNVVLDLSELEMISSLNIGELVTFRKGIMAGPPGTQQAAPFGRVVIAGASPLIEKTLTFTRLHELFPLYPTVQDAVAAIALA